MLKGAKASCSSLLPVPTTIWTYANTRPTKPALNSCLRKPSGAWPCLTLRIGDTLAGEAGKRKLLTGFGADMCPLCSTYYWDNTVAVCWGEFTLPKLNVWISGKHGGDYRGGKNSQTGVLPLRSFVIVDTGFPQWLLLRSSLDLHADLADWLCNLQGGTKAISICVF